MAARTKSTTPTLTPAQITAQTITLVGAVTSTERAGKAAITAATLASFTENADALVRLGQHCTTTLAAHLTGSLTGENVAKLFTDKDSALYPADADERAALKSAAVYMRAIRVARFDSPEARALFLNGPTPALEGASGHTPGVTAYYEWLGAMNADEIAKVKAIPATTLAKYNYWHDASDGRLIYAKIKPAAGESSTKVTFKRTDAPMVASVFDADRSALTKMVADAPFDIDIAAAKLEAFAQYMLARYMLSITEDDATENVTAPTKMTMSIS